MDSLEEIVTRIKAVIPGITLEVLDNPSPSNQLSLLVDREHLVALARYLRDEPVLSFDYASNVTGVDWPERVEKTVTKVKKKVGGEEKEVDETTETVIPGYLEVVYHLYSVQHKQGPLILRVRTGDRADDVLVPSLTPVWRSCEFQEREVYDLYGVVFEGHPDLRRILMWDGFLDYPMRRDYVEPDDYEYEPTPHGDVLEKSGDAS